MPERPAVTVQYYKYPQSLHWRHEMTRLGEDEFGVWLGAPIGSRIQRGHEAVQIMDRAFVQLIAPGRSWTALFNADHRVEVYVDVITAPTWTRPDRVEMIDLDLDVVRLADGTVFVDDEDEFIEHRTSLGYPPRMADTARNTAARLVVDLETRRPPFDHEWRGWLELVT